MSAECVYINDDYGKSRLKKLLRRYVGLKNGTVTGLYVQEEISCISGQLCEYGEEMIIEACKELEIENPKSLIRAMGK